MIWFSKSKKSCSFEIYNLFYFKILLLGCRSSGFESKVMQLDIFITTVWFLLKYHMVVPHGLRSKWGLHKKNRMQRQKGMLLVPSSEVFGWKWTYKKDYFFLWKIITTSKHTVHITTKYFMKLKHTVKDKP